MSTSQLIVSERFCGPPNSGNGGYVCGKLARHFDGAAEATLHAPTPLGTLLTMKNDGDSAELLDGSKLIARAQASSLDLAVPAAPSLGAADTAQTRYAGYNNHPFATCFVCGPDRAIDDGLRIFPGAVDDGSLVAARWRPSSQWTDTHDRVLPEIIWAALDCPSYFGLQQTGMTALLGRMTAQIHLRPKAESECVATGWSLGRDGRKHFAGSAVFSADGQLLAAARAVWIELK